MHKSKKQNRTKQKQQRNKSQKANNNIRFDNSNRQVKHQGSIKRASILIQKGDYDNAIKEYLEVVKTGSKLNDKIYYNIGVISHLNLAKPNDAIPFYLKSLKLNPTSSECLFALGNAYSSLQQFNEATNAYQNAIQLRPDYAEAYLNLGIMIEKQGDTSSATALYQKALEINRHYTQCFNHLGQMLRHQGSLNDAIYVYQKCIEHNPGFAEAYVSLGNLFREQNNPQEAIVQYQKAIEIKNDFVESYQNLGLVFQSIGQAQGAVQAYEKSLSLLQNDTFRLKNATVLAPIVKSAADMLFWRERFEHQIDTLLLSQVEINDPLEDLGDTNFYLSYHGLSNRNLQQKIAKLMLRICPSLNFTAPHCLRPRLLARPRIKIGLISAFMYNHSIGRTTRGFFEQLSKDIFKTYAIFVPHIVKQRCVSPDDSFSRFIRSNADVVVDLTRSLKSAREEIASLELDVLFYQDIGMEPFTYYLAFSRLAHVQCVSFGHPETTGIPNMDYFISNDLFETDAYNDHYSEKVFLLHNLGTLAYYYKPSLPKHLKSRKDFQLSEDAHLYVCPQTLFKFHPDFDFILSGILQQDPLGQIILIEYENWADFLRLRFQQVMPELVERICFVPFQKNESDFLDFIAIADVALDTIHFNGMNTSLQAFAIGLPVVTMPMTFQRGRHTFGMYTKMGIFDCVAKSADEYIQIALNLATNKDLRSKIKEKILHNNHLLFEDKNIVSEFERCFIETLESSAR